MASKPKRQCCVSATSSGKKNTGIENIFNTRKKSTKRHADSGYYASY